MRADYDAVEFTLRGEKALGVFPAILDWYPDEVAELLLDRRRAHIDMECPRCHAKAVLPSREVRRQANRKGMPVGTAMHHAPDCLVADGGLKVVADKYGLEPPDHDPLGGFRGLLRP